MLSLSSRFGRRSRSAWLALVVLVLASAFPSALLADGKLFPPRNYEGSLEERSQEAIIIFTHDPSVNQSGFEHLILKLTVEGSVDNFAWVVPFPSEPKVEKEDAKLFAELFRYVQLRSVRRSRSGRGDEKTKAEASDAKVAEVDVLSRKTVGSYDVAIVRENQSGALNRWLEKEGFRTVEGGDDVLDFYRSKGYVMACIKVADTALAEKKTVDLHPLRFSFATGGYDGIYFPMKLTGLQEDGFLVNLYVFYGAWLNDDINDYGYEHRGLRLVFRDYDGPNCEPNAGKLWAAPESDPYLSPLAGQLSATAKLFTKLEPDQKFYLTNLQGGFKPAVVRQWKDDLWLFPYYTDDSMVPYDARADGPAAALYTSVVPRTRRAWWRHTAVWTAGVFLAGIAVGVFLPAAIRRIRRKPSPLTQA